MNKSIISRSNEVIFYSFLWIIWSLAWVLILSFSYALNKNYDLFIIFESGAFTDNEKYSWISIIIFVIMFISFVFLIILIFKCFSLYKIGKVYSMNDGFLIFSYAIATILLYFGIIFFFFYRESILSTRSLVNDSNKDSRIKQIDTKNVILTDNVVNVDDVNVVSKNAINNPQHNPNQVRRAPNNNQHPHDPEQPHRPR